METRDLRTNVIASIPDQSFILNNETVTLTSKQIETVLNLLAVPPLSADERARVCHYLSPKILAIKVIFAFKGCALVNAKRIVEDICSQWGIN